MSVHEFDLGESAPLPVELSTGAQLARLLAPAPVIPLPKRKAAPLTEPRRFSRLRLMDESAAHYAHGVVEETSPMRKGTATHAFLLGQKDRITVYRDGVRNKKHKKFQEFIAANPGKLILSPTEWDEAQAMRRAVEAHPQAMELLEGEQERRIEWEFGGQKCAGTPDAVRDFADYRRVTELKATWCAKPERLKRHARFMHWHAQVSWYGDGLDRTMNYPPLPCTDHYVVAVESRKPYPVTVLHVSPQLVAKGAGLWRTWWEKLENCEQSNHWPGYVEGVEEWEDEAPSSGLSDWQDEESEDAA